MKRLLEVGAEGNAEGGRYLGGAALWLAAGAGHREVVEVLLHAEADLEGVSGNQGKQCTAAQIANWNGREDVVALLQEYRARRDSPQVE